MLLSDYLTQVRQLVHDLNGTDWTDTELIGHINTGRLTVALDTHCVRDLKSGLDLIANTESYPFNGSVGGIVVTAGGTLYTSAPTVTFTGGSPTTAALATAVVTSGAVSSVYMTSWGAGYQSDPVIGFSGGGGSGASATATTLLNVLDILSLSMSWASWQTTLKKLAFTEFQAFCRTNPTLRGVPRAWSPYREQNRFYLYTIPDSSNTYQVGLDIVIAPDPLVNLTDSDTQIPTPYADAVKWYAAYVALYKLQNPDMATLAKREYKSRINQIIATRRSAWIRDAYQTFGQNW